MKHITIEINKPRTSEEMQDTIVQDLKKHFKVVDDSMDRFDTLRFIHIEGEDIKIDLNGITVIIERVTDPSMAVSIYKRFIHAVEVVF